MGGLTNWQDNKKNDINNDLAKEQRKKRGLYTEEVMRGLTTGEAISNRNQGLKNWSSKANRN